MNENLQKKVEKITGWACESQELYFRLTDLTSAEELVELCREQGLEVMAEEAVACFGLLQRHLEEQSFELSDAELERIAAGVDPSECDGRNALRKHR